jgi:RNA polymerase subunit RPABC4/transcription elongation factor Spt4
MAISNQTSTRFKDEIRIIAPWVFFFAGFLVLLAPVLFVVLAGQDPHAPPVPLRVLLGIFGGAVMGCYVILIGYINQDAGRRGMSRLLWTLISIFVPNGLGILLYFVLRKPRMANCPQCNAEVEPGYSFCPRCRHHLEPVCPHCQRSVKTGNKFCPYCGEDLESPKQVTTAQGSEQRS